MDHEKKKVWPSGLTVASKFKRRNLCPAKNPQPLQLKIRVQLEASAFYHLAVLFLT
jgi:hypothetical protein